MEERTLPNLFWKMRTTYPLNFSFDKFFKILAFVIVIFSFILSIINLVKAIEWIESPFPGFSVYSNLFVNDVNLPHWTGVLSGLKSFDKIIYVNGKEISSATQIYNIAANEPIGSIITYNVDRNGNSIEIAIPTMKLTLNDFMALFVEYIVGMAFLIIGILVYYLKPLLTSSKVFMLFCFSIGTWFVSDFDVQFVHLHNIALIAQILTPLFAIHLSLILPSDRVIKKNYYVIFILYFITLVLLTFHIAFFRAGQRIWVYIYVLVWIYLFSSSIALPISSAVSFFKPSSTLEKNRAQIILLGTILGLLLPALGATLIVLLKISGMTYLAIPVLFFPLSIAYAIVKHKLFDIDVIIQKALVYGALTGVVGGVFALMVLTFNVAFAKHGGWKNPTFFVILSFFLVIALNPLKDRLQHLVDLAFFRTKYDYRRVIEEISSAMTSLLNLDEISDKIISTVRRTMFSNSVSVILFNEDSGDYRVYAKNKGADSISPPPLKEDSELVELLNRYGKEIFKEDLIADERYIKYADRLMKLFEEFNAALFIPMFFKEQLIGILSLGEKKSGLSYSSQDVKLLRILANQSAIAIENASAFKLVEDYARKLEEANKGLREAQAQLIQAEKMSAIGQLAAGIAHEIRNPLNIIEGARYYLSQMIEGGDPEVTKEYLDYIKHEIDRTNRLIDNLLKFSKSELPHFEPVNVNGTLENVLILTRKQLSDTKIKLVTNFDPQIPDIVGDSNQLWQVFINIMMNAIQAMPRGGELQIDTGFYDGGSDDIFISFTDTGVGIDEEDLSKIFDPFFTKKDAGTGLGLSISYKIVEGHRGRIIVRSRKGKGTTFVVELPVNHDVKGVEDGGKKKSLGGR